MTVDPRTLSAPKTEEERLREQDVQEEYERVRAAVRVNESRRVALHPSLIQGADAGLFAETSIAAGDPVTEYAGKLITKEEARRLQREGKATHVRSHITGQWAIDGLQTPDGVPLTAQNAERLLGGRGLGAFANDAFYPNAVYDFVDSAVNARAIAAFQRGVNTRPLPSERITFLRALRPLAAGDEIYVDYGDAYWREQAGDE